MKKGSNKQIIPDEDGINGGGKEGKIIWFKIQKYPGKEKKQNKGSDLLPCQVICKCQGCDSIPFVQKGQPKGDQYERKKENGQKRELLKKVGGGEL